jgi:hypothetical protein
VPAAVWKLADFIYTRGPETDGLFFSSGFPEEVARLQDCLDLDLPLPEALATEAGLLSAAELLLRFLDCLPDAVIPADSYAQCLDACEDPEEASTVPAPP